VDTLRGNNHLLGLNSAVALRNPTDEKFDAIFIIEGIGEDPDDATNACTFISQAGKGEFFGLTNYLYSPSKLSLSRKMPMIHLCIFIQERILFLPRKLPVSVHVLCLSLYSSIYSLQ
jgi:hypothetical protein